MPGRFARAERRLEHPAAAQELDVPAEQLAGDGPSIGHETRCDQFGGKAVDLMDLREHDRSLGKLFCCDIAVQPFGAAGPLLEQLVVDRADHAELLGR